MNRHYQYTWLTRLFSVLLAVFILNLCVTVPPCRIGENVIDSENTQLVANKKKTRFLLQVAIEFFTEENVEISSSASMNLLEELNEVKQNWCHQQFQYNRFLSFYIEKLHPPHSFPMFSLLEDNRFSPPPEFVA